MNYLRTIKENARKIIFTLFQINFPCFILGVHILYYIYLFLFNKQSYTRNTNKNNSEYTNNVENQNIQPSNLFLRVYSRQIIYEIFLLFHK